MARKRLYLIDGSTYIFRAFFAIRGLTSPDGTPVNAVYGFTGMLLKLLREEKPDYLAAVFDKSARSFRNDLYADYKAHRPPAPEELVPQFPLVREVTRAFNIPTLEMDDFEADDIIATLATHAESEDVETVIVTLDKDLMQLVGDECFVLDTMHDVRYGPDEVKEKMGVRPDQVVDYLALLGDAVDNIPGVPGIGKKTAAELLERYGSLDGVYAHLDGEKGKRRENLATYREQAYLSRVLATVKRDVPLHLPLDELAVREPDRAALTELFSRLGFKTWHREFHDPDALAGAPKLGRDGYHLVRTPAELGALAAALAEAPLFAFDTETTGLDPRLSKLVGMSFATDSVHAWYVPVRHTSPDASPQLSPEEALRVLGPLLGDPGRPKAAHNAKFDLQVLRQEGVEVRGLAADTMLMSYVVDAGRYQHSLDNVALDKLNHKTIKFADVCGTGKAQVTFDKVPLSIARDYACEDAQVVMALRGCLEPEVERLGVGPVLRDLEMPLLRVLADMEDTGVRVDVDRLRRLSQELGERARELERCAHVAAGEEFALGSPKQLGAVLFDRLGLAPVKKTKTGHSTDQATLELLCDVHELPRLVLEWRHVSKLKSTYTDVLPDLVSPRTGRIHTSYGQAVAATGRLSSSDPNLQNIPVRTEEGRKIRDTFVPADGHVFVGCDYSQIELRVLAHLTGDDAMKRAFKDGADIHRRTASELFNVMEPLVSREQRDLAKTINFGILYGMSAFRLAREQGISRSDAKGIIDRYFARYPRIEEWKERTLEEARETGQVKTLLGRVRRIPDIRSKDPMARAGAERVAINTPVQGTAADIIKKAMVVIHDRLAREMPDAKMVLQVHDELVFEVPEAAAQELTALAKDEMERALALEVPLVVNTAVGRTWLEAH